MARTVQPKPLWLRIVGGVFYLAFCLIILAAGALAGWIYSSPVVRTVVMRSIFHQRPEASWGGKESVNLLVLGCDEDRYYGGKQIIHEQARSDMMLVARLDFKNNRITGVSIPRDTLAAPQGYKAQKINAYHVLGGADLSRAAVESILPLQIDRVVVLNYKAFQEMIDLVGGVEVDVPKKMDYDDVRGHLHIHLNPGVQRLNGEDAVGFVRFRHSDDDFHRQGRQKDFLVAFKNSLMERPALLPQVAEKARAVMGNSLSPDEMAS
ncbi:MAG: polyisoprenyl-teichoic acid--peptidoglycan teichoic acid transferase, partial [Fimbriimonadaceae bacterium]|nr:polyisoprenyl-teichoic acid--peptidoglycan teichoic acid transferase [Fimbriimonadaceae bacterium]